MFIGHLYVFLGEMSIQILCPFLNWIVCLPGVESCEFFTYFGNQTLVQGIIGKYVSLYSRLSFHFVDFFLIFIVIQLQLYAFSPLWIL